MKEIVVLTALEVERAAVEKHLIDIETVYHPTTGTDYKKGKLLLSNGAQIELLVGRTDQTNPNAALETERALEHFKPDYIFFVGVAGGLKDVRVGDIVIGTNVIGIERGKAEKGNFKPRPQFGASSYSMERLAGDYAASSEWKLTASQLLDKQFSEEINVLTGTIASGEKVDASHESPFHYHIQQNAGHALAIEMEGLGFLEVCRMRPLVKSLLLRGISDMVKDKADMDSKGSQPYASQNVSAFLVGLLNKLDYGQQPIASPKAQLTEIMCKLYPEGLKDNGIWTNAGGNLALINLNQSGKGQWVEAIRVLYQGGGGSITAKSLLNAVSEEYSSNSDIIALCGRI